MSQTYLAAFIAVLVQVLSYLGINIGSEELTTTATTLVTIVSALWIMFNRYGKGDITIAGVRK